VLRKFKHFCVQDEILEGIDGSMKGNCIMVQFAQFPFSRAISYDWTLKVNSNKCKAANFKRGRRTSEEEKRQLQT
jgi:hypothetical protein